MHQYEWIVSGFQMVAKAIDQWPMNKSKLKKQNVAEAREDENQYHKSSWF